MARAERVQHCTTDGWAKGFTPLMLATLGGHTHVVKELLCYFDDLPDATTRILEEVTGIPGQQPDGCAAS